MQLFQRINRNCYESKGCNPPPWRPCSRPWRMRFVFRTSVFPTVADTQPVWDGWRTTRRRRRCQRRRRQRRLRQRGEEQPRRTRVSVVARALAVRVRIALAVRAPFVYSPPSHARRQVAVVIAAAVVIVGFLRFAFSRRVRSALIFTLVVEQKAQADFAEEKQKKKKTPRRRPSPGSGDELVRGSDLCYLFLTVGYRWLFPDDRRVTPAWLPAAAAVSTGRRIRRVDSK